MAKRLVKASTRTQREIMTTEKSNTNNEAQIRTIIEERVKAVGNKDINGLLSNHAADILSFDIINPLISSYLLGSWAWKNIKTVVYQQLLFEIFS